MRKLKIVNPEKTIAILQEEIRRNEDSRYDHRLHGVLLVAQGLSAPQAASLLGDAPRTVEYWIHRFQQAGLKGLREIQRPGRPSRLTQQQMDEIRTIVRSSSPAEQGIDADSWGSIALSRYLDSLGIEIKPRQCRNMLRKWKLEN
jgi:transposase